MKLKVTQTKQPEILQKNLLKFLDIQKLIRI